MKDQDGKLKWVEIFKELQKVLRGGVYPQGVPLPSEEALVRRFGVSRITAVRAMEELRKQGLVWRKRGSGTFATKVARMESGRIGLIMPSLSFGEIFPQICQALTRFAQQDGYSLVLDDISSAKPDKRATLRSRVAVFSCLRRSSYAIRRFGGNRSDFPDHRSERTHDDQAWPVERERTVVGAPDDSAAGAYDAA